MLATLAWRNLWRQKRRTLLTASALALALLLSLLTRCLQEGTYRSNIINAATLSTGLIQIQHPEFQESLSIDDLLPGTDAFIAPARTLEGVTLTLPRLETFALAAGQHGSKGSRVLGILPGLEQQYAKLADKVVAGRYLDPGAAEALMGEGLARQLGLTVGDTLALYGQGYHGQTAAGLFNVSGLVRFPMPGYDSTLVYLPLTQAQALLGTGDQISSWVLHTDQLAALPQVHGELTRLYNDHRVLDWQALSPEMAQQILMDRAGGHFMILLLYGVVGFGLFATLMMMTLERQREFGVMMATGMTRSRVMQLVGLESLMMGAVGILLGLTLALPLLLWLDAHPIRLTGETARMMMELGWEPLMPVSLSPQLMLQQVGVVLILLGLCLGYPLWRIGRLQLVSALKGGGYAG